VNRRRKEKRTKNSRKVAASPSRKAGGWLSVVKHFSSFFLHHPEKERKREIS
jgi:hypothetical protein